MRSNRPQLAGFCFGILTLCFFTSCFAQQEDKTEKPIQQLPIQIPILQLNENRYILKGTVILQFAPGKVIEQEGVLDIQDPALKEACGKLGLTNLVLTPYQIKTKGQTITLPNVYRLLISDETDIVQLCQSLAKIDGIQAAKPIYINLEPKTPILPGQGNQLPPPYPVSNYPDFELWDFNPTSEKNFQKAFAAVSLMTASPGKWLIQPEAGNESNWVLSQVNPKGEADQIHLVLLTPYEDHEVKVTVRIMAKSDGLYKVGGIVYRFTNFENYYEITLDYPEKKMKFYRIHKGVKESLMFADAPLELGKWHTVEVVNNGPRCLAFLDGVPYINQSDDSMWHGKVGVWTRGDDSFVFDDFSIEAIK